MRGARVHTKVTLDGASKPVLISRAEELERALVTVCKVMAGARPLSELLWVAQFLERMRDAEAPKGRPAARAAVLEAFGRLSTSITDKQLLVRKIALETDLKERSVREHLQDAGLHPKRQRRVKSKST